MCVDLVLEIHNEEITNLDTYAINCFQLDHLVSLCGKTKSGFGMNSSRMKVKEME
jgi:hypothetical protein